MPGKMWQVYVQLDNKDWQGYTLPYATVEGANERKELLELQFPNCKWEVREI